MNRITFTPAEGNGSSDEDDKRGTYRTGKDKNTGYVYVTLCCPGCGLPASLNHAIDAQGNITPSLVCPYNPCTFHEFGKLDNWTHGCIDVDGKPTQ